MDLALYDPAGGYYRGAAARPGRDGDFLTAPEAHPIFGAALARAVADAWDRLGRPVPFVLREYGAGTGTLGLGILDGLALERPDLATVLRYEPIEVEPRRLEAIANRFAAAGHAASLASRTAAPAATAAAPRRSTDSSSPTRCSTRSRPTGSSSATARSARWRSTGAMAPSSTSRSSRRPPNSGRRLEADGVTLADGQRAEVCLALDRWLVDAAAGLARGVLLLIDYGYPAAELYDPIRRRDGTLRAYLRHRVHDDPYLHVGRQDLTAHVDVTAVERAARAAGLTHLGTTTQAEFLVGLGTEDLLRAIQADPATTMEEYLAVRSALVRLLDPAAMGRFRVMAFGRGWPDGPPLAGLGYRLIR